MRILFELLTDRIPFVHEHSFTIGLVGLFLLFTLITAPLLYQLFDVLFDDHK